MVCPFVIINNIFFVNVSHVKYYTTMLTHLLIIILENGTRSLSVLSIGLTFMYFLSRVMLLEIIKYK